MRYLVTVQRTKYDEVTMPVNANNRRDACKAAIELAKTQPFDWSPNDQYYETLDCDEEDE